MLKTIEIKKENIVLANSFLSRLLGLMFLKSFPSKKEAMLFNKANWIHSLFMKIPIDVVYLDKNNIVVDIQKHLKPWRFTIPRFKAKKILEFKDGSIEKYNITIGSKLIF